MSVNASDRGRDLDPGFLIEAYAAGFFPMADPQTREISWYSPDPRAVLPLEGFRSSRSLRRELRKGELETRINTAFGFVIEECACRKETWISPEIRRAYIDLHGRGYAHSVETWHSGRLVGGLYGVALKGAFFGESMFSRKANASKVALARLVERLRGRGFLLLDIQFMTAHLAQFGAVEIARSQYLASLRQALGKKASFV